MFLFGKLPVENQQEITMANKEESSPEEIKTYLMRKYQYQQYTSPQTPIQPFNAYTSSNPTTSTTTKPATPTTQPERKRFEAQCFYCGKTSHRKSECRARQRDEANGIKKEDAIPMKKPADPDNLSLTPNWFAKYVATQAIQQETAEDESQKKATLRMAKYRMPPTLKTITKPDDRTSNDNNDH